MKDAMVSAVEGTFPPALMVQGTCSNAGKSLIAMALCRMLSRAGYRVVPFKAQNMALNAAVTPDGGEIGRAQALQAEACGLLPDVRMNPVLLKPLHDHTAELVLCGRSSGILRARDFRVFRADLWRVVTEAYAGLTRDFDCVILEGAGSPAEINLREHDIVNMRMALHAGAEVLLAADIDRGGAFASIVGTMALLRENERACVRGYLLNKFRGDERLLEPALQTVESMTGKPFLATIPWIPSVQLPDEDSVSIQSQRKQFNRPDTALDVAIVRLPHICNTSDFDALLSEPDVILRYVDSPAFFGEPDLVVIPGTRTSVSDCDWLFATGLSDCLQGYGGPIVGICGGFQILGLSLSDRSGDEGGNSGEARGLGLLPLVTCFAEGKIVRRSSGTVVPPLCPEAVRISGYEIHHGETVSCGSGSVPVCFGEDGRILGQASVLDGARIFGTYLHGIFDSDVFRSLFCNRLRRAKGLSERGICPYDRDARIDRVADVVSSVLPLETVLQIIGFGR